MSDRRRLLSRPRTKVYDCNYNLGEQYYKPVVDSLDKKYGGGVADRLSNSVPDEPLSSRRSPFESRTRPSASSAVEDEFESDITASLQRLKAARTARQELEDELESISTERAMKKKSAIAAARESILEDELDTAILGRRKKNSNFADKLLDTVGVNGKLQVHLADDIASSFKKRAQTAMEEFDEEVPRMAKWTALKANSYAEELQESAGESAAKARAKKSRARLVDLDAEMDALVERGNAREKRLQGLKALLSDTSSIDGESSVEIRKRVVKTEKKVNF